MNVSTEFTTIEPHGGELVDRLAPEEDRDELLRRAEGLTKVVSSTTRPPSSGDSSRRARVSVFTSSGSSGTEKLVVARSN